MVAMPTFPTESIINAVEVAPAPVEEATAKSGTFEAPEL